MKRKATFILLLLFAVQLFAGHGQQYLPLEHKGVGHSQFPVPADMPDVYYDDDTQEIIIDGPGMATYYTVDIISTTTLNVMLSDIVGGYYDSIDVSSLPGDDYKIVIVSSNNNTYEGYFNNE